MLIQDPRHRKAGGRTPYKEPYTDPATVIAKRGNKVDAKLKNGEIIKDVHLENLLLVPRNARNLEVDDLVFDEVDESITPSRRSPGMMIEDQGKEVKEVADMIRRKPGKLEDIRINPGNYVAYDKNETRKPKS